MWAHEIGLLWMKYWAGVPRVCGLEDAARIYMVGPVSRDHPPHLDLLAFLLGAASFLDSGLDEVAWSLPDALILLGVVEIEFPLMVRSR